MDDSMSEFDPTDETPEYELLMPFICVTSKDGPYDDDAFVAGMQMGKLWVELAQLVKWRKSMEVHLIRQIATPLVDQAKLFAFHYGLDCLLLIDQSDHDWSTVTFG